MFKGFFVFLWRKMEKDLIKYIDIEEEVRNFLDSGDFLFLGFIFDFWFKF